MYSLNALLVLSLTAMVIGFTLGTYLARRKAGSAESLQKLQQQLTQQQQQQEQYQNQVTEHFSQTGQLLNQLSNSYREVHNHLAQGATQLTDGVATESLKALPVEDQEPAMDPALEAALNAPLNPPLDYAPKTRDSATPGILSESYGIEKNEPESSEDFNDIPRSHA